MAEATVLLTGATGFLGSRIAQRLLAREGVTVLALVRGPSGDEVRRRLERNWWDFPELVAAIGGRVQVVRGDVSEPRLGLSEQEHGRLVRAVTHIIHTAADMRLDGPIEELRRANVQGTANVLELARAVQTDHGLKRMSHVSTAYVAGGRTGDVPEDALSDDFGFSSRYELSKFEGERLVREAMPGLPVSVFRPGLVVGDSKTGAIKTFNTLYFPLRLYLTGRLRVLPARPDLRVNLVPVDYVAEAVERLTFDERASGLYFHLTAPHSSLPTARELLDGVREWAGKNLGHRPPRALFVPLPVPAARGRYRTQRALNRKERGIFDALITLAPYFNERRRFLRGNLDRLLGPYDRDWRAMLPPLLEYATCMNFLHRSDRTVHEQILFRLGSRTRPVTFHDVLEGGREMTRTADEVRRDILAAAGALASMGVRRGDRVALVGQNSSCFVTLDVAIGLLGAVSVPLYYTSPPEEVDGILGDSGARLLLVGAPKVLARVGELRSDVPVVSFCRTPVPDGPGREVVSWEAFLAKGAKAGETGAAPVGLGDLATLRYTSGTTGRPKGVAFRHEGLRWMAESLVSMLPWMTRNRHISYISFLPMNHVVEGILAAYAPYFAAAAIDLYYVEELKDLPSTLKRVRPSIFFAVPRVFEKAWESLLRTGPGRSYVAAPEGLKKSLLRKIIRRALLRRAGWDRCAQLIVGSAPIGADLVLAYRGLGIEVHDAYGLTEAPLVTMNRVGRNRPGPWASPSRAPKCASARTARSSCAGRRSPRAITRRERSPRGTAAGSRPATGAGSPRRAALSSTAVRGSSS
jgi:long-chain acyl-CoA synthetase